MKIILTILSVLVFLGSANAQEAIAFPGGSSIGDTLLVSIADTTDAIDMWESTRSPMPGLPCWVFRFTNIDGSTHDSITADLYVTNVRDLAKDGNGWGFVKQYSLAGYARDTDLVAGEDVVVVTDTLRYMSFRYARWVLDATGGSSDDSTGYEIIFSADKGTRKKI